MMEAKVRDVEYKKRLEKIDHSIKILLLACESADITVDDIAMSLSIIQQLSSRR